MSKYAPHLSVPAGFDDIVRDFAREVLRHQPSNIYQFGKHYFEDLLVARANPPPPPPRTLPTREEVGEILRDVFLRADAEKNGFLHHRHFGNALRDEVRLMLNEEQLQHLMGHAEENDYGMISYAPFVDLAAEVIMEIYDRPPLPDTLATAPVNVILGRHLLQDDFERLLDESFRATDEHGTGMLNRAELRRALTFSAVGLTPIEVNMLMFLAEEDKDGVVFYVDYLPRCFDVVRHYTTRELARGEAGGADRWRELLHNVFAEHDTEGAGFLHTIEVRNLLMNAAFALTNLQIYDLMSCVWENDDGLVHYPDIVDALAEMISEQFEMTNALRQAKYVRRFATADVEEHDIKTALKMSFGTAVAKFYRGEVRAVLLEDSALMLSRAEVAALMSTLDEDMDGFAVCDLLVELGYDVIKFHAFQSRLRSRNWEGPPIRHQDDRLRERKEHAKRSAVAGVTAASPVPDAGLERVEASDLPPETIEDPVARATDINIGRGGGLR